MGLFLVSSVVGVYAGLWQDLISPLADALRRDASPVADSAGTRVLPPFPEGGPHLPIVTPSQVELTGRNGLAVLVEKGRATAPPWLEDVPRFPRPDLVSVVRSGQVVRSFEFYSRGTSAALQEYPFTSGFTYTPLATLVDAWIIDLGDDSRQEILLALTHEFHGLHGDWLTSVLILDDSARVVATAPVPSPVGGLVVDYVGPYSAFRKQGVLIDSISGESFPVAYVNAVLPDTADAGGSVRLAWVVDAAGYCCDHVFQVEEYRLRGGRLTRVAEPIYWFHGGNPFAADARRAADIAEVRRFFAEFNLPPFREMMDSASVVR